MDDQLKKLREKSVYKVPDGYFESVDQRLMDKIPFEEQNQNVSWLDNLTHQLHLRFSIPAFTMIVLVMSVLYISLELDFKQPLVMSDEEIADYLLDVYDEDLELELYTMSGLQHTEHSEILLSDDEIIDYLHEVATEEEIIEFIPNLKSF